MWELRIIQKIYTSSSTAHQTTSSLRSDLWYFPNNNNNNRKLDKIQTQEELRLLVELLRHIYVSLGSLVRPWHRREISFLNTTASSFGKKMCLNVELELFVCFDIIIIVVLERFLKKNLNASRRLVFGTPAAWLLVRQTVGNICKQDSDSIGGVPQVLV